MAKAKRTRAARPKSSPVKKATRKASAKAKKPVAGKTAKAAKAAKATKATKATNESAQDTLITKLKSYVRANAESFLADPNITSVGIGYKSTGGKRTKQISLQFTVGEKVRPEALGALGTTPIPRTITVGGVEVPTDVLERSFSPAYKVVQAEAKDPRRERADTIRPGISVGSVRTTAGTLGAFVRDRTSGQIVILSNWHVLNGPDGQIGDDVVQPGQFDDNRVERNKIGKLIRSHLGPAGDCAIASVSGRTIANDILGINTTFSLLGEPDLDDRVVKSGRTTGVTYGVVTRVHVNTRINYGGGVQETIGGFEIGPDPDHPAANNEISRGGDSGSAWLAAGAAKSASSTKKTKKAKTPKKTTAPGVMLGLHFAGDNDEGGASEIALACYAKSVFNKLEIEPVGTIAQMAASAEDADEFRTGFDTAFLPFAVPRPTFTKKRRADLADLSGSNEIKYCHFSVWLSQARRYPLCVAWNIDGAAFKRLNRVSFRTDRRGDLVDYQLTNDIYRDNVLDKGHIARRADLCWGSMEEAKQGNYDSFYYTNIAPQHEAFNQSDDRSADPDGGVWGRLENTVFDTEQPHDLKVSLMGGPVFSSRDKRFTQEGEECFLPREFWKVVAYVDDEDNKEKSFAFLLTQASLVSNLPQPQGLDFDDWVWARITFDDLEQKTGIRFPTALKSRESPFATQQALSEGPAILPILRPEDYFA